MPKILLNLALSPFLVGSREAPESANLDDAVLVITANDQHHFKRSYFLGEAVLPVAEIADYVPPGDRFSLPQIPLDLMIPGTSEEGWFTAHFTHSLPSEPAVVNQKQMFIIPVYSSWSKLTLPFYLMHYFPETEILRLLQSRTDDKLATEFFKKQRRRIPQQLKSAFGASQMSIASVFMKHGPTASDSSS